MLTHPLNGVYRFRALTSAVLVLLAGCGDDDLVLDAGVVDSATSDSSSDTADAGSDGGRIVGAPFVREALPEPGAVDVEPNTSLLVWFSEEMATNVGTILLQPGDVEISASAADGARWLSMEELGFDDPGVNVAVLVMPAAPLTGGVEYTATAQQDFTDVGGAQLDAAYDWTFQVNDMDPPFVVSAIPAEASLGLSARDLVSIQVEFNEQIQPSGTTFRLEGGTDILGNPVWTANTVTLPLSGIAYSQNYRLLLDGIMDESGNRLDGAPYLMDGRLNFATGPDGDQPRATSSLPTEGQRGVNPATTTIRVEFDEPIDQGSVSGLFNHGLNTTEITGVLDGERALVFEISGLVTSFGAHSLDLSASGITDRAGNALDLVSYLGDGAIDFDVGPDTFGPRVISSDPDEGTMDVRFSRTSLRVRFDEPMNPLLATATLDNGIATMMIAATFSANNTIAEFNVAGRLSPGRAYALDVTSLQDAGGRALDPTAYLEDGILNFTTQDPTGDSCAEPLTALSASMTPDGGLLWNVDAGEYVDDGATDSCDTSTATDDVVIEYVKTTESLANGGAALAIDIAATGSETTNINWELRDGVCEVPASGAEDDAQLVCHSMLQVGGRVIDVGPGTYYIWVAKDTSGVFPGADVTVTEVTEYPEGESCDRPFSVDSAAPVYLPPASEGAPHTFQLPIGGVQDFDRDDVSNGPGNTSCADQQGADAVIRFTKSAGTILEVRAVPTNILTDAADINLEISRGCDPAEAGYQSIACEPSFDRPTTIAASAPAGDVFIWVSSEDPNDEFPGATVTIREIPVSQGQSCGTARPLTMSGSVMRDSSSNFGGGSCLGTATAVTWYSYTPTESVVVVTSDGAGDLLLQDQDTSQVLACAADAQFGVPAVIPAGSTLCIGIPDDSLFNTLSFEEQTYNGVTGAITDMEFERALNGTFTQSWTAERWLRSTPTTLYLGESSRVFQINKRVGSQALLYTSSEGVSSSQLGFQAATIGERLFSADETTSVMSNRVYEVWDARTFPWSPTAWEDNPTDYGSDIRAIAVDSAGDLIVATHDTAAVRFFRLSGLASGSAVEVGSNDNINDVRSMVVDDDYFYMAGDLELPLTNGALVRIPIAELGNPAFVPELLADVTLDTQYAPIAIDSRTSAGHLYYRDVAFSSNVLGVVVDPGSATPRHLGTILSLGGRADYSFTFDETDNAIYLFETQTESIGRIVRVD